MINRKNEIKLRLSDEELADLNHYVSLTGMSREQYLRTIIKGMRPVQTPPLDYFNLIREIVASATICARFPSVPTRLNSLTHRTINKMRNEFSICATTLR